ncbi:MAG: PAS domain S-box protein [Candidatus Tectomicrobia bacterium]|nr:PAS domain S-box protein [Candidatus Tectomicrobia bacterium]
MEGTDKQFGERPQSFTSAEYEVLQRVVEAASSLTLETLLRHALAEVVAALGGFGGAVHLIEGEYRTLQAQMGEVSEEFLRRVQKLGREEGIAGEVVRTGRPIVLEDVSKDPRRSVDLLRQEGIRGYACVPLIAGERVLGTLVVAARESRIIADAKVELLAAVGRQVGLAVERARLHEQVKQHAANQQVLNKLALQVSGSLDEQETFREIVRALGTLLNVPEASVYTYDAEREVVFFRAGLFPDPTDSRHKEFRPGEGLIGAVLKERRPLVVPRVAESPAWLPVGLADQARFVSFAGMPVLLRGEPLGVLSILTTSERRFAPEEMQLLGDFAQHAAIAMQNTRMVTQLRDSADSLRQLAKRQEVLQAAAAELVGNVASGEVIQHILQGAGELLKAEFGHVAVCHWDSRELELLAATGMLAAHVGARYPLAGSLGGEVAERGSCQVFRRDEVKARGFFQTHRRGQPMESLIFVPLRVADSVRGVLGLARPLGRPPFNEEDLLLLKSFGNYAAAALHAADLLRDSRASRARLEHLIEAAGDVIIAVDRQLRIVTWNKAAQSVYGYTAAEMRGKPIFTLWRRVTEEAVRFHERVLAGETVRDMEVSWKHKDGSRRHVLYTLSPISDGAGQPAGIMGVGKDITERRRMELAMQRHNRELIALQEICSTISAALDPQAVFTCVVEHGAALLNARACFLRLLSSDGARLDCFVSSGQAEPIELEPIPLPGSISETLFSTRRGVRMSWDDMRARTCAHPQLGGKVPPQHLMIAPLHLGEQILGTMSVRRSSEQPMFEASELALLELLCAQAAVSIRNAQQHETLEKAEARLRDLYDHAPDLYHSLDRNGAILGCNQTYADTLGYTKEELIGSSYLDLVAPGEREEALSNVRNIFGSATPMRIERTMVRRDGSTLTVEVKRRAVLDASGNVVRTDTLLRDISDRKRAEAALRANELRTGLILDNVMDAIVTTDRACAIISFNRAAERIFGYNAAEAIGQNVISLLLAPRLQAEYAAHLANYLRTGERRVVGHPRETEGQRRDGSIFPMELAVSELELDGHQLFIGILRDISERKQAEAERRHLQAKMQQSQKLESLGVLAGGIAHDFNNLLMGVMGHASLALMELPPESPARQSMQQVETAARRAAELTNQMLAYSGKGRFIVQPLNLSKLVEEMAHLLQTVISKKAVLRFDLAKDLPPVEVDATQVRQVVMNLITNASDALDGATGVITLRTGIFEADRAYLSRTYLDEELPEGRYAYIEVADTGAGMDHDTVAKIFDPFFSTKFTGRGLGLAAVLGIVRGHQGAIKIDTRKGVGTTIRILLPCQDRAAEAGLPEEPKPAAGWRGSGAILVVDDEAAVRSITQRALEKFGFTVLTAEDGREGVKLFRAHADEIVVVLLDMTMPNMNADEASREMRRIRPAVRIILSSGYTQDDVAAKFPRDALAGFIQKPYLVMDLVAKVRSVLEQPPGPSPS